MGLGYGYELMLNGVVAVDTFFFMSGFLVAWIGLNDMEKGRFSLIKFYVHRYIRLTIPVMLLIGFGVTLWPHVGSGTNWGSVQIFVANCEKNWWTNLLYIQNFVRPEEMCLGVTWYLAVDMQYFWISPLLLYPMHKFKFRNAFNLWLVFMIAATAVPTALNAVNNLPPNHVWFYNMDEMGIHPELDFYNKPYVHYQPYLVGMLLAFIMLKLRGKEVKINWVSSVINKIKQN